MPATPDDHDHASGFGAGDIDAASERIRDHVAHTPLERSARLSRLVGAEVLLKREDLQGVRSYKSRGAFNLMLQLTAAEREAGVVCASAGNHAQGFAKACHDLGISGRIFVPRTTPRQKIDRIRDFGGADVDLVQAGATYDEASAAAVEWARTSGAVNVHPFDDPRTIAGQGTVAREIHDQLGASPDVVVVPVGGGGLLAGMATYFAERSPHTTVVGVEPAGAASLAAALAAGAPVELESIDTFIDGAAVRKAGRLPFEQVGRLGVELRAVDEGRVCTEMLTLYQADGIIAEPAGALAPAAIGPAGGKATIAVEPGSTVVCVVSGGNNDISRYAEVEERSLVYEGLRHYFVVDLPQEPGALRRFLDEVLGPDDDISLFEYVKRSNRETGPAFIGVTLGAPEGLDPLLLRMDASPLDIRRVEPESPLFRIFV